MQYRNFSALATLAICVTLGAAMPHQSNTGPSNQCNTGPIQCCQSVTTSNSPEAASALNSLGLNVADITGLLGLTCSLAVDNSCTAEPVCCENNSFNGVVAIGCSPINLNL